MSDPNMVVRRLAPLSSTKDKCDKCQNTIMLSMISGRHLERGGRMINSNETLDKYHVPLWHKRNLNLEEADAYFGIGQTKLKAISNAEDCPFVLWNGTKRLFKQEKLEEYLDDIYSI